MHQVNNTYLFPETKMSDVILGNPYQLLLLEHMEINLELQEKSILEVCEGNKTNPVLFLFLANLYNGNKPNQQVELSPNVIDNTIRYLKNSHSYYLEDMYPQIRKSISDISDLNDSPEIAMLDKFFGKYFLEVKAHLDYENKVVFPYVLGLNDVLQGKAEYQPESNYRVNDYREHHDDIEEKLEDLKNLLVRYIPQKSDRKVRRKLIFLLSELEFDLRIHSDVEGSLLIPLVEKMEFITKQGR